MTRDIPADKMEMLNEMLAELKLYNENQLPCHHSFV
jgi:hypothetical protein